MANKPGIILIPYRSKIRKRYLNASTNTFFKCRRQCILAASCLLLLMLIGPAEGEEWHDTYKGHGTTHEQLGQEHYPNADLTPYNSRVEYSIELNRTSWSIVPAYNVSQWIFDGIITDSPSLPRGYIQVKNGTTLELGPKVEENDFASLLSQYWLILLWVMLLMFLIILLPFIAVCYCCFCCCRRCKMGCGPCDRKRDLRNSFICGAILVVLMILLLIGAIIGFTSNRELDRGMDESKDAVLRSSEDTCRFLHDINEHIQHIFVLNYEELEAHLTDMLNNAHLHIFLDLSDTSESNAIEQLERIFDNMPEARTLMRQVDILEKDLRFYATQLRDGVRGAKRDVNYACTSLMNQIRCRDYFKGSEMEYVDTSPCVHLDNLPNTTIYADSINIIIKDEVALVPKKALARYREIGRKIETSMAQVIPPMIRDVVRGREKFIEQATKIRSIIDAVISDIQFRTLRSSQSFEDVYDRFSRDRSYINSAVCVIIFVILVVLSIGLICGCCFSKGTGATCLLIAIILTFCVFSMVTLVGLGYFMMGLITYQGACAPLRDQESNALFRELDSSIDLNRLMPAKDVETDGAYPVMRMSSAIKACMANESIFDMLTLNHLYNVQDLSSISVMGVKDDDERRDATFDEDLSTVFLLTQEERIELDTARNGNLSGYHSIMFTQNMCSTLTPNLAAISKSLRDFRDSLYFNDQWDFTAPQARVALTNEAYNIDTYNIEWTDRIHNIMAKMKQKLLRVDELILYENRNFSNSIEVLTNAVIRSEEFIRTRGAEYINSLGENLTDVVNEQIDTYINGLITECSTNVGRCAPLAYIYYRGVDLVCYRLVEPMNGYWVGVLLAALFMLPLLFVAHKLMCLWRRMHAYALDVVVLPEVGGCPTCTGAAYLPPPIITCGGGQQTYCVCSEGQQTRTDGGATAAITDGSDTRITTATIENTSGGKSTRRASKSPTPAAKRKRD